MVSRAPPECLGRSQITIGNLDFPLCHSPYLFKYVLITRGESRSVLAPSYSYVILLEELLQGRYVLFLT